VPWRSTFLDGLYNEQITAPEVGQLYSVTLAQVSMRLFANDDLLHEIVGDDPDFKFPVSFEEFRGLIRMVNEFSDRTGRPVQVFAGAKDNARWLLEFMVNVVLMDLTHRIDREGHLARYPRDFQMDYLRGRWDYERPEVKAALELLRELAAEMRPGFIQLERDDAVREFMRGEALFVATGTWDATSLIRLAEFPVSIRRFPQPDKNDPKVGRYIYGRAADGSGLTAMAMYLNKHGANKAAAIDFMHFMTSVEAGQLFMEHSGWISSIRGTDIPSQLEAARAVVDGHGFGGGYLQSGANTTDVLSRNFHLLVGPQGSVDRFVAAMGRDAPKAQRGDLQAEARNLAGALRPQDTELMAVRSLPRVAGPDATVERRGDTLETSQTLSEIQLYQALRVLAQADEGQ
jgi:raffinose/stachyose/melibiose transport system substrate-binding protein